MKRLMLLMPLGFALLLVAGCQTMGSVSDVCKILREPPPMKSETRTAIHNDQAVNVWVASVNLDGKIRGCW